MINQSIADSLSQYAESCTWSSRLFWAISLQFEYEGYSGFAGWMQTKSKQLFDIAAKTQKYIVNQGRSPRLYDIAGVPTEFGDVPEALEYALVQTLRIKDILQGVLSLSLKSGDTITFTSMQRFVDTYIDIEVELSQLIARIKRGGGDSGCALYDYLLNQRREV